MINTHIKDPDLIFMILKTILLYKHLHFLDFTNSSNKIILYKDTSTGNSNMPSQKNFAKTQKNTHLYTLNLNKKEQDH